MMTTSNDDVRKRLNELWMQWSVGLEDAQIETQHKAADATTTWLTQGVNDPEIVIRAHQLLLLDIEGSEAHNRPCWRTFCSTIQQAWPSAGLKKDHLQLGRALLLAVLPSVPTTGYFKLAPLLSSAWDAALLGPRQLAHGDIYQSITTSAHNTTTSIPENQAPAATEKQLPEFDSAFGYLNTNKASQWSYNSFSQQLLNALSSLRSNQQGIEEDLRQHIRRTTNIVQSENHAVRREVDLLWWGQSRYCRAHQQPYRRLKSNPDTLLWWAARDCAALSLNLDVEPAAAYLVETLVSLHENVDETKTLLEWMNGLNAALKADASKIAKLSTKLDEIATQDPLGLPVTWVRQKAYQNESLTDAKIAIGLDLDARIDRGQWASWIFRETLLDLHLAEGS